MQDSCRPWWRNCALKADPEILEIDRMENDLGPVAENLLKIRELISCLELCHHKAERWVDHLLEAIGAGGTEKGLGTRPPGRPHPAETVWQNACAALSAWIAGRPAASVEATIDTVPASRLLAGLGERTSLKEWQVQRVIEKIRSAIHWPRCCDDPTAQYAWLLLNAGEYESAYRDRCPEQYLEHEDFWRTTVKSLIHDTVGGDEAELSLGLAIDMLMPCHWRFVENLRVVLEAIGGKLRPDRPFAACGRNISLLPIRRRMEEVSSTLKVFCGARESKQNTDDDMPVDGDILKALGAPTAAKQWLAASLDKTIRLQMDPPDEVREISALKGPDWIMR